jgi:hypothetical protein
VKARYLILINSLVISILIYLSGASIPPIFSSASREVEITIKATGNKDPNGKGSEVWLYGLKKGGINVPWDEIKLNTGWEFRKTLAVSYFSQPSIASWKGSITAPLTLYLGSHPYSGEVEVSTKDGRKWIKQLYSEKQKKHSTLTIDPPYSRAESIISNLVYSLLISLLLIIFSRDKNGKINLQRGAYLLGLSTLLLSGFIYSLGVSRYFNGLPFNGALQFWNPLRRLALGDLPGRDFFSFHGIGQALAFFPFYKLFGGSFLISEILRQFGTFTLFILSGLYFLKTIGLSNLSALAITAISILIPQFNSLAFPHETSLGLRTSLPLLLATLSYNLIYKKKFNQTLVLSLLGAFCMLWSTEQGPVVLLGIMIWIILENRDNLKRGFLQLIGCISSALIIYYILLSIISLGHANEVIKFALIDIQRDQKWFFGAPPNPFIASYSDFLRSPVINSFIYSLISGGVLLVTFFSRKVRSIPGQCLIVFMLISTSSASLLMQTGYIAELYNAGAERALFLIIASYLLMSPIGGFKKSIYYLSFLVSLMCPIHLSEELSALKERSISSSVYAYFPSLGSSLGEYYDELENVVQEINSSNITFHSDYRGFFEELLESEPTTRFDYIIHALGEEKRNEYLSLFDNPPDYIQTLKTSHTQYARWLHQEIWPYYEMILNSYEPFKDTSSSIVWKRKEKLANSAQDKTVTIPYPESKINIGEVISKHFPSVRAKYWKVELNYELPEKYLGQGFTRNLINYDPDPDGKSMPISLPPYLRSFSFPIITNGQDLTLQASSIGLFSSNSDFKIKELRLTPLNYSEISLEAMFEK